MILFISVASAEPYVLEAERFVVDESKICGFTDLNSAEGSFQLKAAYGCFHFDEKILTIHRSDLNLNGYNFQIMDGVFYDNDDFWLNQVHIDSPMNIKASSLSGRNQTLNLSQPVISPCPCADWHISADEARIENDWLWFEKPKLHVGNRQYSIPKRRLSTKGAPILLPRLSWEEGPWIRQPFQTETDGNGWAEYRTILGPSVSYSQPVRFDAMEITSRLHLGYHEKSETLRGAYTTTQKDDNGIFRSGIQAQIMTDDSYLVDYGTSYMERQQAFLDQRVWAQASVFRTELQQVSTSQEPFSTPTAILEDSVLLGPVMGFARIQTPLSSEPEPELTSVFNVGRDGRFAYASAKLEGHASIDEQHVSPEGRVGTYFYSDYKASRLLSRYAVLFKSTEPYLETNQNLIRNGRSLGILTGRAPIGNSPDNSEFELFLSGKNPVFAGYKKDLSWITIYSRYFQPSVYLWSGSLALVGRSSFHVVNDNILLQPSVVYFPKTDMWQSIGAGLILRQPKQCLQESISVQWMPDRQLPVINFQMSLSY